MTTGHDGTEIGVTTVAGVASTPDSQMLAKLLEADESIAATFGETELIAVRGPTGDSIAVSGNECNPSASIRKGLRTRQLRKAYGGDVRAGAEVFWGLAQEGDVIDAQAKVITLKTRKTVGETYFHFLPSVSLAASVLNRLGLNETYDLSFFGSQTDADRALVLSIHMALNHGYTSPSGEVIWAVEQAIAYTNCLSVPGRTDDGQAMVIPHCDLADWEATTANLSVLLRALGVTLAGKKTTAFGRGNFGN